MIRIRRGLDLPVEGEPTQSIEAGPAVAQVGLLGDDYIGMRPTMVVRVGDRVKVGDVLFLDKKTPGVRYTSPGCGEVVAIHRGAKRRFESIIIRLTGEGEFVEFKKDSDPQALLIESGLWTAFRTRPYSRVPSPAAAPHSIFVTAIDTDPLAPDPAVVLEGREADFELGLGILRRLGDGTVFLCKAPGASIPSGKDITVAEFAGPHPAGLPGTHIHFLDPVDERKSVWHVGYQDVAAIGALFSTGRLPVERVVSVAGPAVKRPRLMRTRLGASTYQLLHRDLAEQEARVVSGSLLSGHEAAGPRAFLGRYHRQVCAVSNHVERPFLGWLGLGRKSFSITRAFFGAVFGRHKPHAFNTGELGEPRAIVPIGAYEKVLPLDLIATPLLKSLTIGDAEQAQMLGCLELDEEDLALCSFVCPGKTDFGSGLREVLTEIEKEG